MDKLTWIKDLVKAEQQMEESGIVEMDASFDPEAQLYNETVRFIHQIKVEFVDSTAVFNEVKSSSLGRIKIYGIAKTQADFMLFRNGYKLIFSLKRPGLVGIRFHMLSGNYLPQQNSAPMTLGPALLDEDLIESRWGAFGELVWTFKGEAINVPHLVRYYLSRFVKESAK